MAHATYHTSHATDQYQGLTWAMDLTPLIADNAPTLREFTRTFIERFGADVDARLARCMGVERRTG